MRKFGLLGSSALRSATFIGLALSAAASASAQVVGEPAAVVPAQAEEAAEEEDENEQPRNQDGSDANEVITVTGSRIRLPNLQSLEPTITVDNRVFEERNFTNAATALNELPSFRGSVTPGGSQGTFGQGVNFVNNFGLGSNRTLTIVNGRRFVSSNVPTIFGNASAGTQVDLNVIPTILIDRIDTVGVGGAPVYGSDAISGTVNVILKTRYDGINVSGLTSITEEGDNFRYNVAGIAGRNFAGDRANITFAVQHEEEEGVVANDREFLRRGIGGFLNPTSAEAALLRPGGAVDTRLNPNIGFNNNASDQNPGTILGRGITLPFLTQGGLISRTNLSPLDPRNPASEFNFGTNPFARNFGTSLGATNRGFPNANALQFDANGNLVSFNQGQLVPGTSVPGGGRGNGFIFNDFNQITSDLRRTIGFGFFTYDLTDDISFFTEGTYFRSRADELVQQPTFNSSLFGGASGELFFNVDNPFLTTQARNELRARGVTGFGLSRASTDLADLTGFNKTNLARGVAGFKGDFTVFNRNLNFEVSGNYGRTKSKDVREELNRQNFINAVNVTRNASGQIVCTTAPTQNNQVVIGFVQTGPRRGDPILGTANNGFAAGGGTPTADPNCVPFNPFGQGVASQAARDFLVEEVEANSKIRQTVFNANVGGSLFDLGAGEAGFNIGYEHREEKARFDVDEFTRQGLGRAVAILPTRGKFNLDEVFGELLLPLVSPENGISLINEAQIFGRGRYTHNSINGGSFAYTVGGTLSPSRDFQIRGNKTRSFRSPAIVELFSATTNTFVTVPDLCSPANRNAGPAPANRRANCEAFLARFPTATPLRAASATVPGQNSGNPDLENEEADSYTFGVIVQPRFIPRFSASADYISIRLNDPIASLTVAQIASACFDNPVFDVNDPANGNEFCSLIRRDATGQVPADAANPAVRTGFINGNRISFSGVQATMNYAIPMTALGLSGRLELGGDGLYVRKRINDITRVAPARSDGQIGDPEFSVQLRMRYVEDKFGINTTLNYTGEQLFSRFNRETGIAGSGPDAREIDELDDFVVVNAGAFVEPTESFRLNFAVQNLFNRQGQRYFGEFIPASISDQLGRRFSVSANLKF